MSTISGDDHIKPVRKKRHQEFIPGMVAPYEKVLKNCNCSLHKLFSILDKNSRQIYLKDNMIELRLKFRKAKEMLSRIK